MGGPGLEDLAIVHEGLDRVGVDRAGEFLVLGLAPLDEGDGEDVAS